MINRHLFSAMLLGAALIIGPLPALSPASAESAGLAAYIGEEPTLFDTADAGVQAFKDTMAKGDAAAVARLLGLDAGKLEGSEGIVVDHDTAWPPQGCQRCRRFQDDIDQRRDVGRPLRPRAQRRLRPVAGPQAVRDTHHRRASAFAARRPTGLVSFVVGCICLIKVFIAAIDPARKYQRLFINGQ